MKDIIIYIWSGLWFLLWFFDRVETDCFRFWQWDVYVWRQTLLSAALIGIPLFFLD